MLGTLWQICALSLVNTRQCLSRSFRPFSIIWSLLVSPASLPRTNLMYTSGNTTHTHTCSPLPVPATTLIFLPITSPLHPTPRSLTDAIPQLVLQVPAHMAPPLKGFPEAGLSRPLVRSLITSCPLHSLNHMDYNTDILKAEVILFIPTCHQASAVLGSWQGWNTCSLE